MTKKGLIFIVVIAILGGGVGYFAYWTNQQSQKSYDKALTVGTVTKEVKDTDVFAYVAKQKDLSKDYQFLTQQDTPTLMAAYPPNSKLVVFVARNSAFDSADGKQLDASAPEARDQIRLYQYAVMAPTDSPDLKDGLVLTTLSKRQISIKKQAGRYYALDAKGRQTQIESTYVSNTSGTQRAYITDNILLPQ